MEKKVWMLGFVLGCVVVAGIVSGLLYFDIILGWLVGFLCGASLLYFSVTRRLFVPAVSAVNRTPSKDDDLNRLMAKLYSRGSISIERIVVDGICGELENGLVLNYDRVLLDQKLARMLKGLSAEGLLSDEQYRRAVHRGLLQYGREMFVFSQRSPFGQLLSPQALGYAASYGTVTPEELASVHSSDHDLIKQYRNNPDSLLDAVMTQLKIGPCSESGSDIEGECDE